MSDQEQWMTQNPDGSIRLDPYAGWSRDKLKARCRDLGMALTDWQLTAMVGATSGGNLLDNVPEPYRTEIARIVEAYSD